MRKNGQRAWEGDCPRTEGAVSVEGLVKERKQREREKEKRSLSIGNIATTKRKKGPTRHCIGSGER